MYVNANFYKDTAKIAGGIRYISHREEQLPEGTTRPLYGLGPRYRELQGDEAGLVQRLKSDAIGFKEPHFFRIKLTVGDALAGRIMALPAKHREWAMRDAVERTFRGTLRDAQGVFVVHYHGGAHRPFGHPHAHVNLSPRLQDGSAFSYIPRPTLARFKARWEHEVTRAVTRQERRVLMAPVRFVPGRGPTRPRYRIPTLAEALARTIAVRAMGRPAVTLLRLHGELNRIGRRRDDLVERLGLAVFDAIAPAPLRTAARIVRALGRSVFER
jgi:hypothetical protein